MYINHRGLNHFHRGHTAYIPYILTSMKVIQAIYMVYRPCDLYESDSSPCDINHQKDYTEFKDFPIKFNYLTKLVFKEKL
jgi:hypothetical protein